MPSNDIQVISPEGKFGTVPKENLNAALEQGFKQPTPDDLLDHAKEVEYGNKNLLAGAAGAIRGMLPFGVGAAAMQLQGLDPETQRGLTEYNPGASIAGELAGSFAPGTGIAGIASKAGKITDKFAKLGENAPLAARIAVKAIKGGVEGATFAGSNIANDAVLRDPNLSADSILSEVGMSTLLGGGLAGGLGIADFAVPKAFNSAKESLSKVNESLGIKRATDALKSGYATVASVTSGVPKEEIMEAFGGVPKSEIGEKVSALSKTLQNLHEDVESSLKSAVNDFDNLSPKAQEAIGNYMQSVDSTQSTGNFARQFMRISKSGGLRIDEGKLEAALKNPQSSKGQKAAEALSNYLDSSHNLVETLGSEYQAAPEFNFDREQVQKLVDKNRGLLEELPPTPQTPEAPSQGHGGLGEVIGVGALAHMAGIPHSLIAGAALAFEGLRNPIETIGKLSKMQSAVSSTAEKVEKLAKVVASGSSASTRATQGFVASKIADRKLFDKRTEQIEQLTSSLPETMDKLSAATAPIQHHAPAIASSLSQASGRAISFLSAKLPNTTPPGPLASKLEPSKAQIADFNKYYDAVENPLSILKEAAQGTLTHHGVEAVSTVYPALFSHMKQSLMTAISNNKKADKIPYKNKLMLSLLLGADLDGSTSPQAMMANQQTTSFSGAQADAKDAAFMGKPRAKGLDNLTVSKRALTAQQATSQRSGA